MNSKGFSPHLQAKINDFMGLRRSVSLGSIDFHSHLALAPMAGICTPPFRLLMQDLGAGVTVSELISCHGILHENKRTLDMLKVDKREDIIGIQLFGEDPKAMAQAAIVAQEQNPKFIDINMGCPVRKVVQKGGGSALMKDIESLIPLFREMKKVLRIPLSIKIRTGWEAESVNADKICDIAYNEGIEWVAIHGRTRAQQYTGSANWDYIEELASNIKLPLIGNGDLHQPHQVIERANKTNCKALMIARGCLRNPFIFLEGLSPSTNSKSAFEGRDYWEIIERLYQYTCETYDNERTRLVQLRKLVVWFAAGFPGAAKFRNSMFTLKTLDECMKESQNFFTGLENSSKSINYDEVFMNSGHG